MMFVLSTKLTATNVVFFILFILHGSQRASSTMYLNLVRPISAGVDGDVHHINIREIEAYDTNNNQLTLTVDSYDSEMTTNPVSNSVDGNLGTIAHTYYPEDITIDHFFKYAVSSINDVCSISRVIIFNRADTFSSRLVGGYLEILDDSTVSMTFDITTDAYIYNLTLKDNSEYLPLCSFSYVSNFVIVYDIIVIIIIAFSACTLGDYCDYYLFVL